MKTTAQIIADAHRLLDELSSLESMNNYSFDKIRPWTSDDNVCEDTIIVIEDGQPQELRMEEDQSIEDFLTIVDSLISTDDLYTFNEEAFK